MKRCLLKLSVTGLAFYAICCPIHVDARTVTWTNTGGGSWSGVLNWSPNRVPGSSDTAVLPDVGDNYSVTLDVAASVSNLTVGETSAGATEAFFMGGQTLAISGQIVVNSNGQFNFDSGTLTGSAVLTGTITWSGGALGGYSTLTVASNGVLNIQGTNALVIDGVLTNAGTVNWSGTGDIDVYNNNGNGSSSDGGIVNLAGALFNVQNDQTIVSETGDLLEYFNNAGTFLKSAGSYTTVGVVFNNTGAVNVQSGTVNLAGSYDLTGGTLNFGINSLTNFGQISLSGNPAPLDGTISANLNSNYVPIVGNTFPVIDYTAYSGTFTNTNLPPVAVWQTAYSPTNVIITVLKLVPQLTWTNPANFVYGSPLTSAQLNATAASPTNLNGTLPGTFAYNPPLGTQLFASNNQILSVTFTPADQVNYTNVTTNVTINVLKAPLTVTATNQSKIYGQTKSFAGSEFTTVGLHYSDSVTSVTLICSGTTATATVAGSTYPITPSAAVGSGLANYSITYDPGLLTVNPAPVTISSGLTANNKVYNRTTTATLSSNNVVLLGVVNGDTVSLNTNGYAANFASANLGNGITVSVSGLSTSGASAANYALTQPAGLTANITAAPVSVSSGLTANNKVYNRTTTATLSSNSVVLLGVVNGDTVSLNTNGYIANFASAGMGNSIAVTVSGLTLSGASAANYALTQPTALTANITAATVSVSAGLTANNKVYDRTTIATLSSNNIALTGVIVGDTVTLNTNGYTAIFASAGVGNGIAVTVSGLSLSGASAANYALTEPSSLTANITAAPVSVSSGITANNKVYDRTTIATLSSNNVALTGVIAGDTVTLNTNSYTANFASAGVGNGIAVTVSGLSLSGASAGNYALTEPSSLTANITAAPVSVTSGITANNKVYDRTTTATLSSNNVTLAGVIVGDAATLNTNGYTANFAGAGVGNGIAVTVSGLSLSGASAGNYALTEPSSLTADITAAPVSVTSGITANNKVYDRTTIATLSSNNVTLTGVIVGDTVTLNTNGYTANFAGAGVGNGIAVTVSGLSLSGASAANYALTQPTGLKANIKAPEVQIFANLPNVVIYWTVNATNFVLNQTTNLTPPVTWTPVTNNITPNGTNNTVTIDAGTSTGHYFVLIAAP